MLGLSYEKVGPRLKLLFDFDLTEGAMLHCVLTVAGGEGAQVERRDQEITYGTSRTRGRTPSPS